jgi:hypothetical protein
MVAPSAFAETVTPPIFCPAAAVTVPLRIASTANAGAARRIAMRKKMVFTAFSFG